MSAKKVLMFGWEYPPHHSGGLGVACQGMAHALIDNDVHVCFVLPKKLNVTDHKVTLRFAEESLKNSQETTTTTTTISTHLEVLARELQNPYLTTIEYEKRLRYFLKMGGKIVPRTLIEQVDHYGALASAMTEEELASYDVIHAHDWLCFPAGISAKKKSGKPLIVHVHATEFDRSGGNHVNQQVYDREREGMELADHIIAVSELTKNTIVTRYGIPEYKVTVVHNGNTVTHAKNNSKFEALQKIKESGKKIVLFAGRITIQKGVDYFIHSAKRVLEFENNVYFVVAGTGDMLDQIKHQVASFGISNHFMFTGYYTLDDQPELFSLADVMVIPSVSEPFGIIPLESLSNKTPLILSKQSGASEVISHALKVDFWDTEKIADYILAIIRNPSLASTLQEEGLRQVNGITWDKAAVKMKALYQKITQ